MPPPGLFVQIVAASSSGHLRCVGTIALGAVGVCCVGAGEHESGGARQQEVAHGGHWSNDERARRCACARLNGNNMGERSADLN